MTSSTATQQYTITTQATKNHPAPQADKRHQAPQAGGWHPLPMAGYYGK